MNKDAGFQGGIRGVTEADIADYLAMTPAFFERHAELLDKVQITSPHGARAVSLQERQIEMLRDKLKGLEWRIMEMLRHGQENLSIAERLHRWTRSLMLTSQAGDLPELLLRELMHQFIVPQAGLRLWELAPAYADAAFARGVSADVKTFASSLSAPYCGANAGFEALQWLAEPDAVMSMALLPLRRREAGAAFGLLVLASPDPTRYSADMGTEFLSRIGELAGAALSRLLPAG
ncbi:MAG: DUF484 family protein [Burkholderiaceae bacterium]